MRLVLVLLLLAAPAMAQDRRACLSRADAEFRRDLVDPSLNRAAAERRRMIAIERCEQADRRERVDDRRQARERRQRDR
jgi:hypothetical protein